MKKFSIAAMIAALFTVSAVAQTSSSGSASGNASVTPGQASAGASASQSAQTPGASANVDTSANAKASHEQESKKEKGHDSSATGGGRGSAALGAGTTLQAELTKSLDAKKAKSGDEVTAKLTQDVKADGKVVMHKGSKLVGHVTEAQAKSKENADSKLGIVFDKAVLKGGEEVAFNGMIQALAPPVQGTLSAAGDEGANVGMGGGSSMGGGRSSGGGGIAPIGAATSAAGSTVSSAAGTVGNVAGSTANSAAGVAGGAVNRTGGVAANGSLTSAAHGVVGMQDLTLLNASPAGGAQGSMITSASRNVKLDSGTQMILQVTGSAAAH